MKNIFNLFTETHFFHLCHCLHRLYRQSNHVGYTERNSLHMMTSSNGNISALLALCAGNQPVPVNSPHRGQWRGALMFSMICVWINAWVNSREASDLSRHRGHYDVIVMMHSHKKILYPRSWIQHKNVSDCFLCLVQPIRKISWKSLKPFCCNTAQIPYPLSSTHE